MKSLITWFIDNPIAANLLMWLIIAGGLSSLPNTNTELFPKLDLNAIDITVAFPGASPKTIEREVIIPIEEALQDLSVIQKINANAVKGGATILLEINDGIPPADILNTIKAKIGTITNLPKNSESPEITARVFQPHIISVAISGPQNEAMLKKVGQKVRQELANIDGVSKTVLKATKPDEISIEVSEIALRQHKITFDEIAKAINESSIEMPTGTIKSDTGEILISTQGRADSTLDFADIIIRSDTNGSNITLGELAEITKGFSDIPSLSRFNGNPTVYVEVYSDEQSNLIDTNRRVKKYVDKLQDQLPRGLYLTLWKDNAISFKQRVNTMLSNGLGGLVLVFIVLTIFLRPLLAFWVSLGVAISFLGAFWLLPYLGVSINMISLFAFLLVLGIVVDDAIIVGESIFTEQESSTNHIGASIGTIKIYKPILFAVISTMVSFATMFFLPGASAKMTEHIPIIVLLILCFSLVEALLILPSHLSKMPPMKKSHHRLGRALESIRQKAVGSLIYLANNIYKPLLRYALDWHYLTIAIFIIVFIISISVVQGGVIKTTFIPKVPADYATFTATLPKGGAFEDTQTAVTQVESALFSTNTNSDSDSDSDSRQNVIRNDLAIASNIQNILVTAHENKIMITVELVRLESRTSSPAELIGHIENILARIPNINQWKTDHTINDPRKAITLFLSAPNLNTLETATDTLVNQLSGYPGIYNLSTSIERSQNQIAINLKPLAYNLSITQADLAHQIRQGFHGEKVQEFSNNNENVSVMLRYPKSERASINSLSNINIRSKANHEIPISMVADLHYLPSENNIRRINQQRSVEVTAELQKGTYTANQITDSLLKHLPAWENKFPGLSVVIDGAQKERVQFANALIQYSFLALLLIYALVAIPLQSYWQPFIILSAVPFGYLGAIVGHAIMNIELSMFSLIGISAAIGVVVNDNLVLLDRINELRQSIPDRIDAITESARGRFRPIILTSLTTFIGLLPMMLETSVQAQFLIPMVTSLAFGVVIATFVTLLLVPCIYLLGEELKDKLLSYQGSDKVSREELTFNIKQIIEKEA